MHHVRERQSHSTAAFSGAGLASGPSSSARVYFFPVIATIVNSLAVVLGSVIGLSTSRWITDTVKRVVFISIGLITIVIGVQMALQSKRILYVAFSLVIGGLLGEWWNIEGAILRLGESLKRVVGIKGENHRFAEGFLNASILFCVGAMALVGSFEAGARGSYTLILTKSLMDGFLSIMLTATLGIGVIFSALSILVYQGALTLLSAQIGPYVSPLILTEVSGVGGVLVMMIGFNLLAIKEIKTANFLPSLVIVVVLAALDPSLARLVSPLAG